jgi:hypothetical protein
MKLRYIQIDPEIIAELPKWSTTELERESEETLKELGITRQGNESYLLAWARAMREENGCEDNVESRKGLIEAIREDWNAQLFVWALGGDERKAFGLEDSPAFQEYLARHYANRDLAPGAFYDHDDPRYWDYQPQSGQSSGARQSVRSGQVARTGGVLWALLPLTALAVYWLLSRDWINRIVVSILVASGVAASFHWSARKERWPTRLALAFCGAVGAFWLVVLLAGTMGAWLMPWKWPWRVLLSVFLGGLFAASLQEAWELLRRRS